MRPVVRTLIAVLLAGFCPLLVAASAAASVQETQQRSPGTVPADSHSLTLSIDKVSPQYARPTSTVTVSGTLSNHTGSAVSGIVLQAQTSTQSFNYRSQMTAFAAGGGFAAGLGQAGLPDQLPAPLANGATVRWQVSFTAAAYYYAFGVYPIEVLASSASSSYQPTAQTFLPFWPGSDGATKPTPLRVAWVWPLVDTPQQGACGQTLATSSLAGSLATGGRLSTLLDTGARWAAREDLTWAIDPALLSDATVMTRHYFTGGVSSCTGRTEYKASAAATNWLATLRTDTAGKPAFATPYADVDASALSHNGLDANLRSAYQLGNAWASKILPGTFGKNGNSGGTTAALAAAWPAGGTADAGVLNSLATAGGVKTVVLSSNELPTSAPLFDNALARTRTSNGTSMSVLLADSDITSILGSVSAHRSAAAQFAVEQDFLAQTAMILDEAPNVQRSLQRSLVVAPPTGWDPSAAEATDLLRLTKNAPWLRPTGLSTLAAQASKVSVTKLKARQVSKAELTHQYVDQKIKPLTANVDLYENLQSKTSTADPSALGAALAVTESAAWRGTGSSGGWLAQANLSLFVSDQEQRVQLIASKKVLLAGTSGTTPVSVTNGLDVPVQVEVRVLIPPGSALQVGSFKQLLTVNPHMTQTAYIPVHSSSIGTTTMQIQLFTRNGSPMTWSQASVSMSVEVTRFGRTLLVIIGGALGVLVLTAIWRLRRKRRADGTRVGGSDDQTGDKAASRAHVGGAG